MPVEFIRDGDRNSAVKLPSLPVEYGTDNSRLSDQACGLPDVYH